MSAVKHSYGEYFIIESNRPYYAVIDMFKDAGYGALLEQEKAGTLPKPPNPTIMAKSYLHHTKEMLEEEYETEDGDKRWRFKDTVIVAEADERGRIFIEKSKPELARRILKTLRKIDRNVKLDPAGAMLPEEDEDRPLNKGGRPRKIR
jgi:hypothetical protein